MATVDCSQYPGSVPGWDSQNNKPTCECPNGTVWHAGMNKCVDEQELALANTDCSHKPGSAPVWSYINNRPECECQYPYSRDPMTGKCVDLMAQLEQEQLARAQGREVARGRGPEVDLVQARPLAKQVEPVSVGDGDDEVDGHGLDLSGIP